MKPGVDLAAGAADTIVGASVTLTGELRSPGNVVIDGRVTGDVTAAGEVLVGQNGSIEGDLQAQGVQVSGTVRGDIRATEKCELRYSAQLTGDIVCQVLEIHPGARFQGRVVMREDAAEETGPATDEDPNDA